MSNPRIPRRRGLHFLMTLLALAPLGQPDARAGDLRAPFDLESTAVLPKGIRNPRFKNVVTWMDEKYSGTGGGSTEPLGAKLNKLLTWDELIRNQKGDDKTTLQGLLNADPAGYGAIAGRATGQITSFANVKASVLAWGLTENWTSALAVPIASIDISASTGFVRDPNAQRLVDKACESDVDKCRTASAKLNDPAQEKLRQRGYEPIRPMSVTHVGDISWTNKFRIYADDLQSVALKGTLVVPTGEPPNPDRIIDPATGDGQWDIALGAVYEQKLQPNLRWISQAGYTLQLPDTIQKRIPESDAESLSYDKETVSRKLGDVTSLGTSLSYEFGETGLTVGGGYNFQFMAATRYGSSDGVVYHYNGSDWAPYASPQAPSERYRLLEGLAREQLLHSGVLSAGYSGVQAYRRKELPIPFQANVSFSKPFYGLNTSTAPILAAEVVLFF